MRRPLLDVALRLYSLLIEETNRIFKIIESSWINSSLIQSAVIIRLRGLGAIVYLHQFMVTALRNVV